MNKPVLSETRTLIIRSETSELLNAKGEIEITYPTNEIINEILTAHKFSCEELIIKIEAPVTVQGGLGCTLFANVANATAIATIAGVDAIATVPGAYAIANAAGVDAIATVPGAYATANADWSSAIATVPGAHVIKNSNKARIIYINLGLFNCLKTGK